MPNGQLIEYYSPLRGQENAKKAGNHELFEKWRSLDTDKFTDQERDEYGSDVKKSWDKYQAAWEDYLKSKGQTESEALASFRILIADVSSRTRSKLSLRSSAVKQPLAQTPSTFIADNTPGSQTNNLPSDKSSEAKPLNSPIANNLVQANMQNKTDKTEPIDEIITETTPKPPSVEQTPDNRLSPGDKVIFTDRSGKEHEVNFRGYSDTAETKDNHEIVGWRLIREKAIDQLKNQVESEGGHFLITNGKTKGAAGLSAPTSDSDDKDNTENKYYSLELQEIELMEQRPNEGIKGQPEGVNLNNSINSISATNLLQGVEKLHEKGN